MFIFLILSYFLQAQITIDHFMGVNLRREDPIQYLNAVGFVREYHDWAVDEGNWVQTTISNNSNTFQLPVPAPQPNNKYKWNPGFGTFTKFDGFYQQISDKVGAGNICATMKSCLPYLSGGSTGFFLEFKPVSNSFSGTVTQSGLDNTTPITFTPLVNTETPSSYSWYADWVYQFALKYGNNPTIPTPVFKRYNGEPNSTSSNFPKIKYMELWNEPDKYFFTYAGSGNTNAELAQDGWFQATKFSGKEYAALASAAYDANGTSGFPDGYTNGVPNTSTPSGIKNADLNIKIANGGTAGIREYDWKFLMDMKNWFTVNRTGVMPFKVINFHHYNSNKWFELGETKEAASPEEDRYNIGTLANVNSNGIKSSDEGIILPLINVDPINTTNRTFKQRLIELKNRVNTNFPGAETWLSEFGFDTNDKSPFKVPKLVKADGSILDDKQEVQGRFLVRAYLEIAAAGFDRAMMFCIRDSKSSSDAGIFDSNGLVLDNSNSYAPKKSYYYVSTMKETLKNTKFDSEIVDSNDPTKIGGIYAGHSYNFTNTAYPRIFKFQDQSVQTKSVYAIWLPTKTDATRNYKFYPEQRNAIATLVTPKVGDFNGEKQALSLKSDGKGDYFSVDLTENPQYICIGQSITDATVVSPSVTAIGISCDAAALNISNFNSNNTYSVYYYEKNDQDENGVSPTFNIDDLNFKRYAPNSILNFPTIVVGGLNLRLDNYYFYVIATDNTTGNVSAPTSITVKTTSCSNNVIKAVDNSGADAQLSGILNTEDYSLCYPIRNITTLKEWVYNSSPNVGIIKLVDNSGIEQNFNINLISLIDGTSEGNLKISYAPLNSNTFIALPEYFTSSLYKWIHQPVNIIASRIKIERTDENTRISKIIFRGTPVGSSFATACCGANENNIKTISGNTTVSEQIRLGNLENTSNSYNKRQVIKVSNSLTVDNYYGFVRNSLIYMQPGSKIIVNPNAYLCLDQVSIQGCDQKWQGIEVQRGAYADMSQANIRDAEIGVKLKTNYDSNLSLGLGLYNSVFEENLTGVANEINGSLVPYDNLYISGTIFDGNNRYLKPDYAGSSNPTYPSQSLTGISLQNFVTNYLGYSEQDNSVAPNYFQNMATGINLYNSTVYINNTVFKNIKPGIFFNSGPYFSGVQSTGGYGIQATSGKLVIDGTAYASTSPGSQLLTTFDRVTAPIYLYSTNFDIQKCSMTTGVNNVFSSQYGSTNNGGIYTLSDGGGSCRIKDNTIFANGTGITSLFPQNPTLIDGNYIDCNNINGETSTSQGSNIFAIGSFSYGGVRYGLASNVFTITNNKLIVNHIKHSNGIAVNGIDGGKVENNTISARDFINPYDTNYDPLVSIDSTFMINVYNSTNSYFNKNTLIGLGGSNIYTPYAVGIKLNGSPSNDITCNGIRKLSLSIVAEGGNATGQNNSGQGVGIAGNVLENFNRGIFLKTPQTELGIHSFKGNKWLNPNSTNLAGEFNNGTRQELLNSRFTVYTNESDPRADPTGKNAIKVANGVGDNTNGDATAWFIKTDVNYQGTFTCPTGTGFTSGSVAFRDAKDADDEFNDLDNTKYFHRNIAENPAQAQKDLNLTDASLFILKRDAYNYYKDKLLGTSPKTKNLINFLNESDKSDIGILAKIEQEWANLNENEFKLELNQIKKADTRLEQLNKIKPKLDLKKLFSIKDGKERQAYIKSITNDSISILHSQISNLQQKYAEGIAKKATKLLEINDQLNDKLDHVKFEKEVNKIYYSLLANKSKTLSKADAERIKTIAMMCPNVAGRAPYKARALYALVTTASLPEWNCNSKIAVPIKASIEPILTSTLYPNPSSGNITVNLDEVKDFEGYSWIIIDLTGRKLKSGVFSNFFETISTADLTAGAYFIHTFKGYSVVNVQKFTLIKN